MTKNAEKKRTSFWRGLLLFCGIFLALVAAGLCVLWAYLSAYETSRPQTAIARYMETITGRELALKDKNTYKIFDRNLQNEEDYLTFANNALYKISYAKNTKLSNEEKQVYMILSGGRSVGNVILTVQEKDVFGFGHWSVTEENIDISFLMEKPVVLTVPDDYLIYANGVLLDDSYLTDFDLPYTEMKDYYRKYELPTLRTYTVGQILGSPRITITDGTGAVVDPGNLDELTAVPDNCSESRKAAIQEFLDAFLLRYVHFTMGKGGQGRLYYNYYRLKPYVMKDSSLALRLEDSLDGLYWILDRNAQITELKINHMVDLGDDHYLCDFSYVVDGRTYAAPIRNEANVKLIIEENDEGLFAVSMTNY